MTKISPIILTSKPATKHLEKIRVEHSNMLKAIQNQQRLVEGFNQEEKQNKTMEQAQNFERESMNKKMTFDTDKLRLDADKLKMDTDTKRMAEENKRRDLELKEKALLE